VYTLRKTIIDKVQFIQILLSESRAPGSRNRECQTPSKRRTDGRTDAANIGLLKSHKYVCITTYHYQPDTKSNPNRNPNLI